MYYPVDNSGEGDDLPYLIFPISPISVPSSISSTNAHLQSKTQVLIKCSACGRCCVIPKHPPLTPEPGQNSIDPSRPDPSTMCRKRYIVRRYSMLTLPHYPILHIYRSIIFERLKAR